MSRAVVCHWCWLTLVLFGLSSQGWAESAQNDIAQRTSKSKSKARRTAKKLPRVSHTPRNFLHRFTLRLLYTPSYRWLSKQMRDDLEKNKEKGSYHDEVAQFFPLAGGLEGEFAFNTLVSLAVGGNFVQHSNFFVFDFGDSKEDEVFNFDCNYLEMNLWSSLYFNVRDYFRVGGGLDVSFHKFRMEFVGEEKEKQYKVATDMSWKQMSAHLALRRDFFLPRFGFGVGLNVSVPVVEHFGKDSEQKFYVDGEPREPEATSDDDEKLQSDDYAIFAAVLMPMLYVTF